MKNLKTICLVMYKAIKVYLFLKKRVTEKYGKFDPETALKAAEDFSLAFWDQCKDDIVGRIVDEMKINEGKV